MRINLNDTIRVRLTERGRIIHEEYQKGVNRLIAGTNHRVRVKPVTDDFGQTEYVLWQFMEIFGPHLNMGTDPVVIGNDIHWIEEEQ